MEAARLAERAGDLMRARHDDEQALAITTDDRIARRLRAAIARIEASAGSDGQWAQVAAEHERLESAVQANADPKPALRELASLIDGHPGYPRAARAMVALARGWQRDGNLDEARAWLERAERIANAEDRPHVIAELVRVLVVRGDFIEAHAQIDGLDEPPLQRELREIYARALVRYDLQKLAWTVLLVLAEVALLAGRLASGSWRELGRALARPPLEALFVVPIAGVLAAVAATGNPLVARAVLVIATAGVVVTWISGAILERVRAHQRVSWQRAALHAGLATLAIASATYIAVDHGRTIDQIVETWRSGPEK